MADLSGLSVGDEISVQNKWGDGIEIRRVEKIHKRYLTDNRQCSWDLRTGCERPAPERGWRRIYASPVTEELKLKAIRHKNLLRLGLLLNDAKIIANNNAEAAADLVAAIKPIVDRYKSD